MSALNEGDRVNEETRAHDVVWFRLLLRKHCQGLHKKGAEFVRCETIPVG